MRLSNLAVGSVVYLKVDGVQTPFRLVHHGKPGDMYDDSFLGGTILMLDCTAAPIAIAMVEEADELKGDYSETYAHKLFNGSWLAKLESAIAGLVVQVRIPYRKTAQVNPYLIATGAEGLPAKVWLPSIVEVSAGAYMKYDDQDYYVTEGARFDYFKDMAESGYDRWKVLDPTYNIDTGWGTRTPGQYGTGEYADCFCKINAAGQWFNSTGNGAYVRPCLVLPSATMVNSQMQVTLNGEMPVKVNGVWRAGASWVKTGGVWRRTQALYGKVAGAWKE